MKNEDEKRLFTTKKSLIMSPPTWREELKTKMNQVMRKKTMKYPEPSIAP
jgi:hypothetical protein